MSNAKKNYIYSAVLLAAVASVWVYRNYIAQPKEQPIASTGLVYYTGKTMGVITYNVKYLGEPSPAIEQGVDSLLKAFNQSLSNYIPDSEISRFNQGDSTLVYESVFFYPVLRKSEEVWRMSQGAFDPTIAPLYKFWGFGPEKDLTKDTTQLAALRALTGFGHISYDERSVSKSKAGVQLDFGAVAKGYAVDLVGDYLKEQGLENYFVEIGGEVVANGVNHRGLTWSIAIKDPRYKSSGNERKAIVSLPQKGLATSGNYEQYYEENGQKYVHTINPITGLSQPSNLLSATVIANDCMTADAWATAFMVLGLEPSKELLEKQKKIEAYFIYDDNGQLKSFATEGFEKYLLEEAL